MKGGRFARHCAPAHVFAVILSDIVGDPVDMIASGPVSPDSSTCADALAVAEKYALRLSDTARRLLAQETPKTADNVTVRVTGSVRELCAAAAKACRDLGYTPEILTDCEQGVAREVGARLGALARRTRPAARRGPLSSAAKRSSGSPGIGKGGRNQELALAAAAEIAGAENVVVFSVGSDGTDGRRTPRAASRTAARSSALPRQERPWRTCSKITTPTTRCATPAISSSPAPRVRT